MKALLLTAPSRLELVDLPAPAPHDDEVLLRIRACGICGSDIHGWDGSTGRRRPPLIMGHEAAGEVAALGDRVAGWRVGDRVTFDSTVYCGCCEYCARGQVNLCAQRRVFGVAPEEYRQHGAFAELLAVPARVLHRVPAELPFEQAAMAEPVSVALHAVSRVKLAPDDVAVVIGAGMIGLLVIQALRCAGVKRVIAFDQEATRLALARTLGATETLLSGNADAVSALAQLAGGRGPDAVFEVVGGNATVNLALRAVRRGGAVVLVGNLAPQVEFPLQLAVNRELTIHGSCASAGEYPAALACMQRGAIRVAPLLSALAPLRDGPEWFKRLSAPGGGAHLKVILQP